MVKHFSIRVSGKVQGVFFRASTQQEALRLGVYGVVRNEPDGSVYIEAEAEESVLNQFLAWCHHGPPHAHVSKLEVQEGKLKQYVRFIIER